MENEINDRDSFIECWRDLKLHNELLELTKYKLYELRVLKQMDRHERRMFQIQSKEVREREIYARILMNRENESQTEYILK